MTLYKCHPAPQPRDKSLRRRWLGGHPNFRVVARGRRQQHSEERSPAWFVAPIPGGAASCPIPFTERMNVKKIAMTLAGIGVAAVSLSGCGSWNDHHGVGDAPAHQLPKQGVDVFPMPDEFPNIATLCDGHGHRMYVPTHNKDDVAVTVIVDASCGPVAK